MRAIPGVLCLLAACATAPPRMEPAGPVEPHGAEVATLKGLLAEAYEAVDTNDLDRALAACEAAGELLVTKRELRARYLAAAADHYRLEEYAEAEEFAQIVATQEPDNALAAPLARYARCAQHLKYRPDASHREFDEFLDQWYTGLCDASGGRHPRPYDIHWPSPTYWAFLDEVRALKEAVVWRRLSATPTPYCCR